MPTPQPLSALTPQLREELLHTMVVSVRTQLTEDPDLDGVQQYNAAFLFRYRLPLRPMTDKDREMVAWAETHGASAVQRDLTIEVGAAHMVTADMAVDGVSGEVDMISHDYGHLSSVLAYGDGLDGALAPAWEAVEADAPLALLIGHVLVHQPFRGHDLGLRAMLLLLNHFSSSCAAVLLYPGDITLEVGDEKQAAHLKLTEHWSRIGFNPYYDGAMLLDMADDRRDLPHPAA